MRQSGLSQPRSRPGLVIVGGGPASLSLLLGMAAVDDGRLFREIACAGVVVVDQGEVGPGVLGRCAAIRSNTSGGDFTRGWPSTDAQGEVRAVRTLPEVKRVVAYGESIVPLQLVASMYRAVWAYLRRALSTQLRVLSEHTVRRLEILPNGDVQVRSTGAEKAAQTLHCRAAVLATGGAPREVCVPGLARPVPAERFFSIPGSQNLATGIRSGKIRRIAVVGNSHTAWAFVWLIWKLQLGLKSPQVDILARDASSILPPLYYGSVEEAPGEVLPQFICPRTGKVNRFRGLRGIQKDAALAADRGELPWVRVRSRADVQGAENPERGRQSYDLVVSAAGYVAATVPVFRSGDGPCGPALRRSGAVVVDGDCRVVDWSGNPIHSVFALGFRHSIPAHAEMGGEPHFSGTLDAVDVYAEFAAPIIAQAISEILERQEPGQRSKRNGVRLERSNKRST